MLKKSDSFAEKIKLLASSEVLFVLFRFLSCIYNVATDLLVLATKDNRLSRYTPVKSHRTSDL